MDAEKDYNLLSEIMHNANIGWWKADIQDADYIYYGPIASLLGLEEGGCISFENFNKRILREEQPHTTIRSFDNIQQTNETVYLLDTVKGPTWVRSKICMQKTDENGKTKIYGIAEIQDGPYMSSATQMLRQREQLLHNIYKHLPVGIEVYNTDGVLTDLNDKELEMFHLQQKEDLLGINIFDNPIFPKEMKEKLKKYEDADFTFRYDFSKVGSYYNPQTRTGTIDLVTKVTTLYDEMLRQREQLLHNIYKHLPVGIEVYNTDGVLTDLNDKELEMFHLQQKEDLLGINIFDNPIFPKEMKEKLKKYEDADFTFRYDFSKVGSYYNPQTRTGTIDLVTKVTTLYDENHTPANYLLINADKTETTVAYNKIQEFESFFELIGNYAKVGYAHYDLLTRQGDAQHSWYINIGEQEGTPLSRIIGVYRHIHPEDRRAMLGFLNNAAKGMEDKFNKEVRVLREDGSYTWTHVNLIVKTYAPERNSIELICINYDITRLKATEAMLTDAKEKAEESDRLKSAFLANMSHEIRTPLNAIIGFSSLLPHIEDAEERNHYISLINHNNELLLNIINDVLDLSKIEAGHIELAPVWCNLSDLIDESCTECQPNVPEGVTLKKRYPATPNLIKQDPMRIKQVLSNLISNALKNTVQGYVEISYEMTPSETRISVSDTGRGIPEEKLGIIFERFEKADTFIQGAGLGLPICRSIMEHMNGTIEVTSTVNKGSTFTVVFPCQVRPME